MPRTAPPKDLNWIPASVEICFERREMQRLKKNGAGKWETVLIVTPRLRLADGTLIRCNRVPVHVAVKQEAIARREEKR
jgi:hypothetical protein